MWHGLVTDYYRAIGAPLPYPPPGPIAALGTVAGRNTDEDPPVTTKEGRRLLEARRRVGERMLKAEEELYRGPATRSCTWSAPSASGTRPSPATRICSGCATASTASPATGSYRGEAWRGRQRVFRGVGLSEST